MTETTAIDADAAYRAATGRDPRFDGRFFLGVTSTRIYCRPSCPARKPLRRNAVFFPSAAAAVAAGFRACKRCRPDALPGTRDWDARGDLAARAVRLIRDGAIDELGVAGLATRLSVSERHLHRVLVAEVGASPQQLGRTRRAQAARTLVEQTALSLTDVAFAAGFGSVRQFNDVMLAEFGMPPSQLRRPAEHARQGMGSANGEPSSDTAPIVVLRLRHRPPYDTSAIRAFLAAHAVPGMEHADEASGTFTTVVHGAHGPAVTVIDWGASGPEHLTARIRPADVGDLTGIVARLRRWLDLDADPQLVAEALGPDPIIGPLLRRRPGLRLPGSLDPAATALLTVLGQQVSLRAAQTFAGRLVSLLGEPVGSPAAAAQDAGPDAPSPAAAPRAFPTPAAIAAADPQKLRAAIGLTGARTRTLQELAAALASGLDLSAGADRDAARSALLAITGIGPWTADYIALRALGDPDAFTADDLVLKRALGVSSARAALVIAEHWRPWRGYALMHLWTAHAYSA